MHDQEGTDEFIVLLAFSLLKIKSSVLVIVFSLYLTVVVAVHYCCCYVRDISISEEVKLYTQIY